jgi:hypothetical protein
MADITHQSAGFFDDNTAVTDALIPLQTIASAPSLSNDIPVVSSPIAPDVATRSRLAHFPPELYDLSPASHLSRLMSVLLGDAGAGQIRKRMTTARLQATLEGSHYFDLDGFYGALFGANRRSAETLSVNPMVSVVEPDQWDTIAAQDASYRQRIIALAQSTPMAATVPGLKAAAEALTQVECDVIEAWSLVDAYQGTGSTTGGSAIPGRTWTQVQTAYPTWNSIEVGHTTWSGVEASFSLGSSTTSSRDEVVIRPKKDYSSATGTEQQEDQISLLRVLSRLKPAGTFLSVDPKGLALHSSVGLTYVVSDSDHWEIITKVTPRIGTDPNVNPYPVSDLAKGASDPSQARPLPVPPYTATQTQDIYYNGDIITTSAFDVVVDPTVAPGVFSGPGAVPLAGQVNQVFAYGTTHVSYTSEKATADPQTILAAQTVSDSSLASHSYSQARVPVVTHG